jgi:hypothetical protein
MDAKRRQMRRHYWLLVKSKELFRLHLLLKLPTVWRISRSFRLYSFWLLISFPLPSLFTSERKTSSEREEMAIGNRRAYVTVTFLVSFLLPSSSYSRHEYNIAKERQFWCFFKAWHRIPDTSKSSVKIVLEARMQLASQVANFVPQMKHAVAIYRAHLKHVCIDFLSRKSSYYTGALAPCSFPLLNDYKQHCSLVALR